MEKPPPVPRRIARTLPHRRAFYVGTRSVELANPAQAGVQTIAAETLELLECSFPPPAFAGLTSDLIDSDAYHPALKTRYAHLLVMLYSICSPFMRELQELAYIAAACWFGFVQPVRDDFRRPRRQRRGRRDAAPHREDMRIRLVRLFTPSLSARCKCYSHRYSTQRAGCARTHLRAITRPQGPRTHSEATCIPTRSTRAG